MINYLDEANQSKAWPFVQARSLLDKFNKNSIRKDYILFETGYGPSGLPHIGTFAEVVRTTMVRNAFSILEPKIPSKLFTFSDDMDGLRKVPENIPNQDLLESHIGKPLTSVPDPFEKHESFGHSNNSRLKGFLDSFGFEYEFKSSTECYKSGQFDNALISILQNYDKVMEIILPTLGPERQLTYSPFLPICKKSGKVLQVPIIEKDTDAGTIIYEDSNGSKIEVPVTGGACKLQWKCDWAMRWFALGVDYEMAGKDLIDSVKLSSKICRTIGGVPPQNLIYELFLDENGQKISKSKGNGISVEDWLNYAPIESLSYFIYQKPSSAKRLSFETIPKSVDEYLSSKSSYFDQDLKSKCTNPVFHVHNGDPHREIHGVSFSLLLNLVSVCHTDDPKIIWYYINRYYEGLSEANNKELGQLIDFSISYYRDFVLPNKEYRIPSEKECDALKSLKSLLQEADHKLNSEQIQQLVYDVGKEYSSEFTSLRDWFKALYEILLGQEQGPRIGSFISLYGVDETIKLIETILSKTKD
ncbi:MAG: lysine--tRNA ligase [Alphaproteobacteria bacterium TMED87]|nr:lysine--tRNA ligase [Rhodospirillaceae bacterium]OUV11033.1 MAG: lysine--tRNA ligase [Alphaproteobacteria bacterium TMED87]